MKQGLFLITFLFILISFSRAQTRGHIAKDSIKKQNQWFIATYPSSILLGDISAGVELNHKRIRQEVALFYKCFTFLQNYLYEKGYGVNYYLKYNFINRNGFLVSADLGYVYRKAYYENKVTNVNLLLFPGQERARYITDRTFCKSGLSLGLSNLTHLGDRFYLGINACVDFVRVDSDFIIKEHVSGQKLVSPVNPNTELLLPYNWGEHGYGLSATFLIKLAYEL